MLGTKAGLMAVGKFVGESWAGTRKDYLGEVKRDECSGNGRRGEEEENWEEEEEVGVEEWEEREEKRWREWRMAERGEEE